MTRSSFTAHLPSTRARLRDRVSVALALTAMAFAVCTAPSADAQTHGSGARAHTGATHARRARANRHLARARAHKAACVAARTRHGSHACSTAKGRKHRTKPEAHHKHATGGGSSSSHTTAQGKAQTSPPATAPSGSPGATCSDGLNATLDEEGTFACTGGGEPGCREGFAPVVADDGSTLVCEPEHEPEQVEAGGDEEG